MFLDVDFKLLYYCLGGNNYIIRLLYYNCDNYNHNIMCSFKLNQCSKPVRGGRSFGSFE